MYIFKIACISSLVIAEAEVVTAVAAVVVAVSTSSQVLEGMEERTEMSDKFKN